MYRMPMSKHISKHIYGAKEPNQNVFLKQSLVGTDGGPVKLEKLGSVERRR